MSTAVQSKRPLGSLLYDQKARGVFFQVLAIALLVWFVWWLTGNTVENLASQDKKSGFGFLSNTSGFNILSTLGTAIMDYDAGESSYLDVFFVGIINTLAVSLLGIIAATVIGFMMGVFRLSKNVVLRTFSTIYIEVLRNIPLLLQLFFWYFFALRAMPSNRDRLQIFGDSVGINKSGLFLPAPIPESGFLWTLIALVIAIIACVLIGNASKARRMETGRGLPTLWISLALIIGLPTLVFLLTGKPLSIEYPNFISEGPKLKQGFERGVGMVLVPEMIAVWLALSLYTASFIAEIVRAGILAISHGQTEAAYALGLRPTPTLRLVIIPQALRVIIPPLTSQYLNLTKNSSLAVAIAYPDLVSVFAGTALSQVGQEIEMIFMMMMVYLTISLVTSAFMNWFNQRIKLIER